MSFRLTIPDRPGVLGIIATRLGELGANILEVDHRRLFLDVPAKGAKLDVTLETRDAAHAEEIMAALAADGYSPVRLEAVATTAARSEARRGQAADCAWPCPALQLLDDRVALVHGEEIVCRPRPPCSRAREEGAQMLAADFELIRCRNIGDSARSLPRAVEGLELHALDVELDEIDARQTPWRRSRFSGWRPSLRRNSRRAGR